MVARYNYFHDLQFSRYRLNALKEEGYQGCQITKTFFDYGDSLPCKAKE